MTQIIRYGMSDDAEPYPINNIERKTSSSSATRTTVPEPTSLRLRDVQHVMTAGVNYLRVLRCHAPCTHFDCRIEPPGHFMPGWYTNCHNVKLTDNRGLNVAYCWLESGLDATSSVDTTASDRKIAVAAVQI